MTVQFSITEVKSIIKPQVRFVAKAVRLKDGSKTEDRESTKNIGNIKTQKKELFQNRKLENVIREQVESQYSDLKRKPYEVELIRKQTEQR